MSTFNSNRTQAWWLRLPLLAVLFITVFAAQAQTERITPAGDGSFSNGGTFLANGWTEANSVNNPWIIGTVPTGGTFSGNSAYGSNAAPAWSYNTATAGTNFFWRDVTVPAGEGIIVVSFDWQGIGEAFGWDNVQVYVAPTTVIPAGSATHVNGLNNVPPGIAGATFIAVTPNPGTIGVPQQLSGIIPSSFAGTTFRLIFSWKSDTSLGGPQSIAVDNISLTSQLQVPICGNYTIDNTLPTAGLNFNSFTAAINYINLHGICGPLTFDVTAGQTFAENTPAITATGTAVNTITFQRSGAGANPVITPTGSAGTTDAGLTISGSDFLRFNGIDVNASAVATVEYGYLVRNRTGSDGASSNIFENFTVRLNRTLTSSRGVLQSASTTGGGFTPLDAGGNNNGNIYRNFNIRNVYAGFQVLTGSTIFPDDGTVITTSACGTFNSIGDPAVTGDIGGALTTQSYGIQFANQNGFAIQNTEIRNVTNTTGQLDGINITSFSGTCTVNNNIIRGILGTGSTTIAMSGLRAVQSTAGGLPVPTLRMYNNVISEIHRNYTGVATATRGPRGIFLAGTSAINLPVYEIWNNTVVINNSAHPLQSNAVFETTNPITGAQLIVRNNIFQNNTIAQGITARHYGFVHTASATQIGLAGTVVTNNDIFISTDLGVSGFTALSGAAPAGNRASVALWQAAVAQASGNLELDPLLGTDFVSSQAGLDATGFSPAPGYLTTDLGCAPRQNDVGAYNINACVTPVAGTISGSGSACDLDATVIRSLSGASTGLGISYQWAYGTNLGGPYPNLLGTAGTQDFAALAPGTYYVVVDVTCSAGPTTATTPEFTLVVNPNPTATAGAVDAVLCVGETLDLTGTTDIGTTWAWTGPNAFTSSAQNPQRTNMQFVDAGNYSLVTSAGGCNSPASVVSVSVNPLPVITSVTATPNPICFNGSSQLNAIATLPGYAVSGVTYGLQPTTGFTNGPTGDDILSAAIPLPFTLNYFNTPKTTFQINTNGQIGFNYAGSSAAQQRTSQLVPSTVLPNDNISLFWTDLNATTAGMIQYGTIGTTPNRIFVVSYNNVPFFSGGGVASGQIHIYETTNVIEMHVTSLTLNATFNRTLGLENAAGTDGGAAPGRNNSQWFVAVPEAWRFTPNAPSYSWSPNTFLDFDNIANPLASAVTATTPYTVTATSPAGCTAQQGITVTIGATMSAVNITPVAPAYCAGGSVLLTATPVDGGAPYTYQWYDPLAVPMGTAATQSANLPGLWSVDVLDNCGTSILGTSVMVIENPTPTASASAGQACMGGTLQLTGTTDIGTTYAWTGPNAFTSTLQNPTVSPVVAASAGNYIFTATLNGCASTPSSVPVVVDPSPIITSTTASPNPVCTGNDSQLNVNIQPSTYCAATITGGSCAGDEYLTNVTFAGINNNSGCVYGAPNFGYNNFTAISGAVTAGSSYTLEFTIAQFFTSDQAALFADWNQDGDFVDAGEAFAFPTVVAGLNSFPGAITVPAGATNGSTRIRVRLNFAAAAPACGGTTFGEIEDYSVVVSGGVPPPVSNTFLWTPNTFLTADNISNPIAEDPTTTTAYSVLVTGGNGCTSTGNVTLTVNQTPNVTLSVLDNCGPVSTFTIPVEVNSTGNGPTVNISYTVNGGAPIVVTGLGVGTHPPLGPFAHLDEVVVTIIDPTAGCNVPMGLFRSACPELITCGTPLVKNYCYDNNDTRSWHFHVPTPGETLQLNFITGLMAPGDVIRGYSGVSDQGTPIPSLTGTFADLSAGPVSGTTAADPFNTNEVVTGQDLYLEIQSDATGSCVDMDPMASSWQWEVKCNPNCVAPTGTVTNSIDCFNQEFSLDVEVTFTGDALTCDLEYTVNAGPPVTIPGLIDFDVETIGPFAFGDVVQVFLRHEVAVPPCVGSDANLGSHTYGPSSCNNDEPCASTVLTMNPNYTCVTTSAGNMTAATLTAGITGGCVGVVQDRWYRFTATAVTHRVQLAGTTTGLSHSLYTGACGALTLVPGTACTAGATASNPASLTVGQIYYVRVSSTAANTNAFTVCVSAPPLLDVDATTLLLPAAVACYGATETVSVNVQNTSLYTLDMSVNPLTVNVAVTGAATVNLTGTINSGTLAPGATIVVPMSSTLDMTVVGTYTFNGTSVLAGDGNAANDPMTATTRTTTAPVALPQTNNFTGFTGANLTTVFPNWREATGAAVPTGTTSAWTSSALAQQTQLGQGVSARINMSTLARNEWIVGPKFVPVAGTQLSYVIAVTEFGTGAADAGTPSPGMQPSDQVIVKISTDCGATYSNLIAHTQGVPAGLTNSNVPQIIDLSAYAGQQVIIAFHATKPATTPHPSYDFHLDNINIQNVAVCAGPPIAGTATSSQPGPVCAPASTTLSISGQSTSGGVTVTWFSSPTAGGPYLTQVGTGTAVVVSALEATTYFVARVRCTLTNDDVFTNEVSIQVIPTPTASATAGPACTGQALNFNGTSDIATSYAWTGPNAFSSTLEDPTLNPVLANSGGNYIFTATANGCSRQATVAVSVNTTPVITALTATPNPVCIGNNSQLQATAPVSGYFAGSSGSSWIDISGTGTPIATLVDETQANITIPGGGFTFSGINYTALRVSDNGVAALGATTGTIGFTNAALPTTLGTGTVFLAPWWDDHDDDANAGTSEFFYGQVGNLFILQWNNMGHFSYVAGQVISFQAQLNLVTGQIFFVYNDVLHGGSQTAFDSGLGGTIGIQWAASAGNFIQHSFNAASLSNGQVISYTPNQATFQWTPNTYLTADNIANPIAQNVLANETYSVVATASNGCSSAPSQLTLVANPPMVAGDANITPNPASFCTGGSVLLTANTTGGGGPYTFAWTDPNSNPAGTAQTQSANIAGTWSVLVNDNCGGSATANVVVTEYPVPVATAAYNAPGCTGSNLILDGGSSVAGSTFAWTGPGGFTSNVEDPNRGPATLAMTGTYTVIASANGCSSAPVNVVVSIGQTPTVPAIVNSVPTWAVCPGGSVNLTASSTALTNLQLNGGAITIPAGAPTTSSGPASPYPSAIAVSGLPTTGVTVKQVLLNGFTHTWPDDVDVLLQSPAGTNVVIMSDAGSGTDATGFNYVFQDGAAVMTLTVNPSGTYRPFNDAATPSDNYVAPGPGLVNQPTPLLSSFTGNPNGNWNLYVVDDVGGDVGSFSSWGIVFEFNNVTYSWTGAGLNTNIGPAVTATPTATTTYTVTAENASCTAASNATVYYGDQNATLELETDANGPETSWEVVLQSNNLLLAAGSGYPSNAIITVPICLPQECMHLRVLDGGGNGITNGGYILRQSGGNQLRIIDDENNFTGGGTSAIANVGEFCLPMGPDRLIYTSCDKIDWRNNEYIVANDNPVVSAEFGGPNAATSGYQMWWYNPNGGYSFRRFQSHNTSNGLPASPTRACHFRVNGWVGNQLVAGTVYNVKVRGRVSGVNNNWGAACRFILDPVRAQCPLTKLMDIPGNQYLSCGATRPVGTGTPSLVHARPVTRLNGNNMVVSANRYQFRFRILAESFSLVKTSQTGQYWTNTNGLTPCKTYEVDVRASFDNGATWCTDFVAPFLTDPWGDVCLLNTTCAFEGSNQNMGNNPAELVMYPNPNRGDQLFLGLDAIEEGVMTVDVEIVDAFGKRVSNRTIPVKGGFLNTMMSLNGDLAGGMYMVNITAGEARYTERLVIQP